MAGLDKLHSLAQFNREKQGNSEDFIVMSYISSSNQHVLQVRQIVLVQTVVITPDGELICNCLDAICNPNLFCKHVCWLTCRVFTISLSALLHRHLPAGLMQNIGALLRSWLDKTHECFGTLRKPEASAACAHERVDSLGFIFSGEPRSLHRTHGPAPRYSLESDRPALTPLFHSFFYDDTLHDDAADHASVDDFMKQPPPWVRIEQIELPGFVNPTTLLGDEPCPVCYESMTAQDNSLTVSCIACTRNFHESCMQSWFGPGNHFCPLCRHLSA